jgi:hypothetical protein
MMQNSVSEHDDGNAGPKRPQSMMMGGRGGGGPRRPQSMANLGGRGGRGKGRGRGSGQRQPSIRPAPAGPYENGSDDGNLSDEDAPPTSRLDSAPASYPAPKKPQSILRNSSHHAGGLRQPARKASRVNVDGSVTTAVSSDSMDDLESPTGGPLLDRTPSMLGSRHNRSQRPGYGDSRSGSLGGSFAVRDPWASFRKPAERPQLSKYASTRSVLTADLEFENEPKWKTFLRYVRLLPPHKDEKPIKKRIRIFTWVAMVLDFLAALVSITTYDGVSFCCGEPVLSIAGDINWTLAVRITTYIYMILIFAEIVPVLRNGVPFNLLNPFIGFLITFAVFFDDRILEAVVMWIIEGSAVACEFFVYRLRLKVHVEREERLAKTEEELAEIKQTKRKIIRKLKERKLEEDLSDEASFGEKSFHDETTDSEEQMPDLSQVRETRLLRERRLLRQTQSEDCRHLRYHFIGVAFNVALVAITLMLICCIGRSGGLCVRDMIAPNVFKTDQLERCYDCQGTTGVCEICRPDGTSHCYYPYF